MFQPLGDRLGPELVKAVENPRMNVNSDISCSCNSMKTTR